jgi:hypothetical protein
MNNTDNFNIQDYEENDSVRQADNTIKDILVGTDDTSIESYIESLKYDDPTEYAILRQSRDDYLREKKYDEEIKRLQSEARQRYETELETKKQRIQQIKDNKKDKVSKTLLLLARIAKYDDEANFVIKRINNFIEFNSDYDILTKNEFNKFYSCFDNLYLNRINKSLEPKIPKEEDEFIRNTFICDSE